MPETPAAPLPTEEPNALPPGTRFGELEILQTIGIGGFGIVYLAQDHALERLVAIKEYMPGQLAQRGESSQVSLRSASYEETFDIGRRSFVNEARLLARFDHRSLLKVHRFWEANGTAYMAMPYLRGQTLKQVRQVTGRPTEAWLRGVLLALLDGLTLLHGESVYHRDISPDNILMPEGSSDPILLDFGAARRAIGDSNQTFTAILKPRYAPIEQYGEATGLRQGPWTDLYALGAVIHFMLLGDTPPPATTRTVVDNFRPLARLGVEGYSAQFLAVIDWSLGVRPQDRPQSARDMRAALMGELTPPVSPEPAAAASAAADHTVVIPSKKAMAGDKTVAMPSSAPAPKPTPAPMTFASPAPAAASRSGLGIALVGAAIVVVAGIAWWAMRPSRVEAPPPVVEPTAAVVAPAAAPASSVAAVAEAASTPLPVPEPVASAPAPSPQAAMPVPTQAPSTPATRPLPTAKSTSVPSVDAKPPRETRPAPRPENTVQPPPTAQATEPAPVRPLPPRPALSPAAATPNAPSNTAPAVAKPVDPRDVCGGRVFIALDVCMERECKKPGTSGHAECVSWRKEKEDRDRYGK